MYWCLHTVILTTTSCVRVEYIKGLIIYKTCCLKKIHTSIERIMFLYHVCVCEIHVQVLPPKTILPTFVKHEKTGHPQNHANYPQNNVYNEIVMHKCCKCLGIKKVTFLKANVAITKI